MPREKVVEAEKGSLTETKNGSCAEMHRDGVIICPTCHNRIEHLTDLRCPRCNASLIKMGCDGNCKNCGG